MMDNKKKSKEDTEVPPPFENPASKEQFYEFYAYLKKTKLLKTLEIFLFRLLMESCVEENSAIRLLRQCFGGISQKNQDTTKITEETDQSAERTKELREELKVWMVRFIDAVERSTNHTLFVDESLRGKKRAEAILKQFGCLTKLSLIQKARMELGQPVPKETAAGRAAEEREALTAEFQAAKDADDLAGLERKTCKVKGAVVREYRLDRLGNEISPDPSVESCSKDYNIQE